MHSHINQQRKLFIAEILERLSLFFPHNVPDYTPVSVEAGLEEGMFLIHDSDILPYLQTAFFDEKIVEIELDNTPGVYFSRIHDHTPELVEVEEYGHLTLQEPEYAVGNYLKEMTHLISLPLEPGMGNLHIRNSQRILIRFFTSKCAIELGTCCEKITAVRGLPVLQLTYPKIGRLVQRARAFRARVTDSFNLKVIVGGKKNASDLHCRVADASINGMSFLIQKKEQALFRVDESRALQIFLDNQPYARIAGTVRHVTRIRSKTGTEYRCGVQFELTTRAQAAQMEMLVAGIQRAHLQELAELAETNRVRLIR